MIMPAMINKFRGVPKFIAAFFNDCTELAMIQEPSSHQEEEEEEEMKKISLINGLMKKLI